VCTGNENSKPIWNKIIIRKDIIETSQVVLNFCRTVVNSNLYILDDNFSVDINLLQKQSILISMLMSNGYLPNSLYTKKIGVVALVFIILFKNWRCTFSMLSYFPIPNISHPCSKIGATNESKIFNWRSIGSRRFPNQIILLFLWVEL